jgi:cell division septal protein FtsQ
MNITTDVVPICSTCQTSNGFSSADQRSIILMVVLTSIALLGCYVGVIWYAALTRFVLDKSPQVIAHSNETFNTEEEQDDEFVQPVGNTTTTQVQFSDTIQLV